MSMVGNKPGRSPQPGNMPAQARDTQHHTSPPGTGNSVDNSDHIPAALDSPPPLGMLPRDTPLPDSIAVQSAVLAQPPSSSPTP